MPSKSRIIGLCISVCQLWLSGQAQDVTLVWDPNPEADLIGYNVYRSQSSGSGFTPINTSLTPVDPNPTFTDISDKTGLSTIFYVVTAVNTAGLESNFSTEVTLTLDTTPPSVTVDNAPEENYPPVADAGPAQTVDCESTVTLSGSATDPEGDPLTYSWEQISGPSVRTITDASKLQASFTAPTVTVDTDLLFRLTVSDETNAEVATTVEVTLLHLYKPLVFPFSLDTGHPFFQGTFVGTAVANLTQRSDDIVVSASDSDGNERANVQLNSPVAAKGQNALLTTEIVSADAGAVLLLADGENSTVQGFFMVGDSSLKKLDGIGGELKESKTLYFPVARHTSTETSLIFLYNPNDQPDPNVSLQLLDRDGNLEQSEVVSLNAGGVVIGTLDQIFGDGIVIEEGFIQADAAVPLKGFEFCAREEDLFSLTAQPGSQTRRLLVPHFFVDGEGGTTQLRLLNVGDDKAFVHIKAFDDEGNLLGTNKIEIEPKQLFVGDVKEELGLDTSTLQGSEPLTGYLDLDIAGPGSGAFVTTPTLIGTVSFSANQGTLTSAMPMIAEGQVETVFLHVAQSKELGVFNGLAIFNPEKDTARVKVQAIDQAGVTTGEKEFDLPAGKRVVGLLNETTFFGSAFSQVKGHLRVSSITTDTIPDPVPVIAFALFGSYDLDYLTAVEGQKSLPWRTQEWELETSPGSGSL